MMEDRRESKSDQVENSDEDATDCIESEGGRPEEITWLRLGFCVTRVVGGIAPLPAPDWLWLCNKQ